jgi:signal peptidase II
MRLRRVLLLVSVLAVVAGCDHAAKRAAVGCLADAAVISLAGDTVRFELAYNPGGFLSLGARLPDPVRAVLFQGLVPVGLALFCVLAWGGGLSRAWLVGLGLVAGGGGANWLDRILHDGHVTDFVSIGLGAVRTGVFNVADVAIIAGVLMLLWPARSADEPVRQTA